MPLYCAVFIECPLRANSGRPNKDAPEPDIDRSGRQRLQNGGSPQFFCFWCQTAAPDEPGASHSYESGGVA